MKRSNLHTASSKNTAKRWVVLFVAYLCFSLSTFAANHFVSSSQLNVDGNSLNIQPGDTIFLEAGNRPHLRFVNINGTADKYITIINHGGTVVISTETHYYGAVITQSSFFRFTGTGNTEETYGIKIMKTPAKANGLSIDGRSTDYEIDHIEIANTGFAGLIAFTAPNCDGSNNRGNFVQRNTIIRNNYIHDTAGEAMYIGHSFYNGINISCNNENVLVYPHEIHGLRVYDNIIERSGWDGIQVGCATVDCEIYGNSIENYGVSNVAAQNVGLQIAAGTTGKCYNNVIINGSGNGMNIFGKGNNYIYNNIILNAGNGVVNNPNNKYAILVDDREPLPQSSYHLINNTIISPNGEGIYFLSKNTINNVIVNNLILNPGAHPFLKNKSNAFINVSDKSDVLISNNLSLIIDTVVLSNNIEDVFSFCENLNLHNQGYNTEIYSLKNDFYGTPRYDDGASDIGAFEYNKPKNMQKASPFTAYPNPTKGDFEVRSVNMQMLDIIRVKSLNGVVLLDYSFNNSFKPYIQAQNKLKRGIYLVEYISGNEQYTDKLIIN